MKDLPSRTARVRALAKPFVPTRLRTWVREKHLLAWPPVGHARFGSLRRTTPIDDDFGYGRGLPIDRYYIDRFVAEHAADIRGVALEFQDDTYLRRHGQGAVTTADVMNVESGYPGTTIVADLAIADGLPTERFDCIVCTATLQVIYEIHTAVRNLHHMLRPGGVLLVTLPGINRIARDPGGWEDHWRLTTTTARKLFGEVFGADHIDVDYDGNPLVAAAFLMGLAAEELKPAELHARHQAFEVLITVRAVRPE
jgi:SAM-dependent methyltransferase